MKSKVIVICGPTGVGKTALAEKLSQIVNGAIVACDSRQVYVGMDIGTGKDISNLGVDLANPNEAFSVMNYVSLIKPLLDHLIELGKTPIITAGTGLYLKSLFSPPQTGFVKPNPVLRRQLDQLSLENLKQMLEHQDPKKWQAMNSSDRANPRRLIRALEIAMSPIPDIPVPDYPINRLTMGLTAPLSIIDDRINARVLARAKPQFTKEVKELIKKYPNFASFPAATATGYSEWLKYLSKSLTRAEAINIWQLHERQYARRQLTWFKKMTKISWHDITQDSWQESVVELVQNWYS